MEQQQQQEEEDEWEQLIVTTPSDSDYSTDGDYKYKQLINKTANNNDNNELITKSEPIILNALNNSLNAINTITGYYSTDSDMPSLVSDSSDEWFSDSSDEVMKRINTMDDYNIIKNNQIRSNLTFKESQNAQIKYLKQYNYDLNVLDINGNVTSINETNIGESKVEIIESDSEEDGIVTFINNTTIDNSNENNILITSNVKYEIEEKIEDTFDKQIIKDSMDQWVINVPVMNEKGVVVRTKICADPGANSACIDAEYAYNNFKSMICKNKGKKKMDTPGGIISPKYCLWMTFPTTNGIQLMRKMYLVNDLPVKILADINMLKAFGYKFKDETPPVFRHKPIEDENYELRDDFTENIGNYRKEHWVKDYYQNKVKRWINYLRQDGFAYMNDVSDDYLNERFNDFIFPQLRENYGIRFRTVKRDFDEEEKHILDYDNIDPDRLFDIEDDDENVKKMINFINKKSIGIFRYTPELFEPTMGISTNDINVIRNKRKQRCPIFNRCLFLMSKQSYLATDQEIEEAKELMDNKELKFNDLSYLKEYANKYGKQWNGTYEAIMKWIDKNRDIFAKHQFDRRTLNVPPARLGINEDERDTLMYAPQYPINSLKRKYMINYTLINKNNGFWHPINYSLYSIPYTMIPKKRNGKVYIYRPAFDARIVNQHCTLIPILMPTIKDFRELHSIKGFVTMADFKNFFDCIPLHRDDWKYTVVHTPLGLFEMSCLTYGFLNSASIAQAIVNPIAMYIGDCLIYIDDICIKHRFENGIKGIIDQLNRMAEKIRLINGYLNPNKFYPACDYSEGFGWQNTMLGTICSDAYRKKMLAVTKPTTKKEIQAFSGLINYMNNNIYNCKIIMYWINRLEEETDSKGKGKHVKWTKQANLSWEQIRWLIAHLPILHHPTISGTFCLQTDACNYGVGGVLWQQQINPSNNQYQWYIIDMHSKVVPKGIRKCNTMILEAYAIAVCCEHWSFYLRGKEFIISTDNMPIANIFGKHWKELTVATRKTLENFRSRIADLDFESYHIEGLNNPIADGLSRFTLELIKKDRKSPLDKQDYPLQLSGIYGKDLDTPEISEEEEKKQLELYCNNLEVKKKDLIKHSSVMLMKCLNNESNILLINSKRTSIQLNPIDKIWNGRIMNLRNEINGMQNSKLKKMIYNLDNYTLRSNEYNYNNKSETNKLIDNYNILLTTLFKNDNNYNKNSLLMITNKIEEKMFDIYSSFINNKRKHKVMQVVTRSQTQKQMAKPHLPESQRDYRKAAKSNLEFQNIRYAFDTRQELIEKLFGKIKDKNALDLDRFYQYQNSDNLLSLVSSMYNVPKSQWKKEDLKYLKKWDYRLYKKLINGKIRRKESILMVQQYDTVMEKKTLRFIVPFALIGDLLVHYHHTQSNFHNSFNQTFKLIERTYWWSTLKEDVKYMCDTCILCQQLRGTQRKRTPLQIRLNPKAFDHVFADFLGPVYGRFYILVFVDQRSGFCRLVPTDGCDALVVLESLINKWSTLFGYPLLFESDWGSGFNNKLMNTFAALTGMRIEIAEPRYHRSIGKVERVIGILQNIIAKYNLALEQALTDHVEDIEEAWQTLEILIPQIQFNMNQFISRISGLSSNEIAFGRRFNDPTNNVKLESLLKQLQEENEIQLPISDLNDFRALISLIDNVNKKFINKWKKYIWLSRKSYRDKNKITIDSINKYKKELAVGSEVLYFIGDKQVRMNKWKEKWSGPWVVEKHLNDTTLIITDPKTGDQRRTNFNRVKLFNDCKNGYVKLNDYLKNNEEYNQFQEKLFERMQQNKGVDIRNSQFDLDYNQV